MTEIADRYRRLADAFAAKVAAVPADRWGAPTPCEGWDARELVRHVVDTQGLFLGFVGRELGDIPSVDDDPAAAWDAARAVVQADLDDPDRAGATYDSILGTSRFEDSVDNFLSFDLVVHGWDLARAVGLDETIDPDEAKRVLADAEAAGEVLRSSGHFSEVPDVAPDADVQTRMLAATGRKA